MSTGTTETDVPLTDRLVCRRGDDDTVQTNVPHLITHHSPTGFEFGYAGSGPADLALNVTEFVLRDIGYEGETMEFGEGTGFRMSWYIHQQLKWDVIAPLPRWGGEVPYETIKQRVQELRALRERGK